MPDDSFPVEVVGGVPVLAAPEEIDITNADALRSALLTVAAVPFPLATAPPFIRRGCPIHVVPAT